MDDWRLRPHAQANKQSAALYSDLGAADHVGIERDALIKVGNGNGEMGDALAIDHWEPGLIRKLKELYDACLISKQEYVTKHSAILSRPWGATSHAGVGRRGLGGGGVV